MSRRGRAGALLGVGCWLLAGCAGRYPSPVGTSQRPAVTRGDLEREVLLTGELVAEDAAVLAAPSVNVWPLLIRWLAEDGAAVQAGDPVVELDNSRLSSNLEELRLAVLQAANRLATLADGTAAAEVAARFAVDQAQANADMARIDAAVPEQLLAASEVEKRRFDVKRAELALDEAELKLANQREVSRAEVEMQRVALAKARLEVERADSGIARLTLRAPRAGIVSIGRNPREDRTFESGDTIWPGLILARLPVMSTVVVEARLYDLDDGLVAPGMAVTASLDAFPAVGLNGRVRTVDPFAQDAGWRSQRRFFRTVVELDLLEEAGMLPGMSVKVVVHPPPQRGVLLVPRASLDWDGNQPRAVLADGRRVEVALGPCSSTACVLASGLEEGAFLGRAGGQT